MHLTFQDWTQSLLKFGENFEFVIAIIIFDSNSQVRFLTLMGTAELKKSPAHGVMHAPPLNIC